MWEPEMSPDVPVSASSTLTLATEFPRLQLLHISVDMLRSPVHGTSLIFPSFI